MKKSDCETIQKQIPLYIDNMLADEELDSVQEHIEGCDACRRELALMQSILANVKALPEPELSEDFHERFVEKLKKEASKPKISVVIPWKKVTGFAAAAAVVALSVASFFQLEQSGGSQNPDVYLTEPTPAVQQEVPDKGEESDAFVSETEKQQAKPSQELAPKAKTAERTSEQETHMPQVAQEMAEGQPAAYTPSARIVLEEGQPATYAPSARTVSETEQGEAVSASAFEADDREPVAEGTEITPFVCEPANHQDGGAGSGAGAVYEETTCCIVTVTVAESAKEQAEEILSAHTKDDYGYAVGDSLNDVLARLEVLEGYSAVTEENEEIAENYIVLQ